MTYPGSQNDPDNGNVGVVFLAAFLAAAILIWWVRP
jgi:hypothetical protein